MPLDGRSQKGKRSSKEKMTHLDALALSFLNPGNMCCCVVGIGDEQIARRHVSEKGERTGGGQLFIGVLFQQVERFHAGCGEIGVKRFHALVAVIIYVGLIPLV